jgi:hypothetical protein
MVCFVNVKIVLFTVSIPTIVFGTVNEIRIVQFFSNLAVCFQSDMLENASFKVLLHLLSFRGNLNRSVNSFLEY